MNNADYRFWCLFFWCVENFPNEKKNNENAERRGETYKLFNAAQSTNTSHKAGEEWERDGKKTNGSDSGINESAITHQQKASSSRENKSKFSEENIQQAGLYIFMLSNNNKAYA